MKQYELNIVFSKAEYKNRAFLHIYMIIIDYYNDLVFIIITNCKLIKMYFSSIQYY